MGWKIIIAPAAQADLREVICRSYRAIYRLRRDEQQVDIVRWEGTVPGHDFKPSINVRCSYSLIC